MVFYRTYRPQKISELDSQSVREGLSSILSGGKGIAHAFLFTGPRGLGKTSAARIVAKIVNCEKRKDTEPCNKCEQCTSITNGTNLDVLEIDAASNRGIDEIRDLREKIKLAPSSARKKVYIIDEVHMLTTEAFNALLKTLEEPPDHAIFILATTDLYRVPETIQSRCFHIAFRQASEVELVRSLKRIVKGENMKIDDDALVAIAKISDGSFRDASKLLEQAVADSGRKKITQETVDRVTGAVQNGAELFLFLKERNTKKALAWITETVSQGTSMRVFLEDCLAKLHAALLEKYEIKKGDGKMTSFDEEELKKMIKLFSRAHGELKTAVIPQLPIEMAIIEYCMEKEI